MPISDAAGAARQCTLKHTIYCQGIGLHGGVPVRVTLKPASPGSGIRFLRTDIVDRDNEIEASWDRVVDTRPSTVIANGAGVSVATIEHLMAALRGKGIDNALIEINGPEVPIMDGSAAPFTFLIDCAGREQQAEPRRFLRIVKEISIGSGDKAASLVPDSGCVFGMEIEFPDGGVPRQERTVFLDETSFHFEISHARTFGFLQDVEVLRANGFARGATLDNAIVMNQGKPINEGGLRFPDELLRHKILDSIGDLYLAGAPILGRFHGVRSGHALNNQLLRTLFADRGAWTWEIGGQHAKDALEDHMAA